MNILITLPRDRDQLGTINAVTEAGIQAQYCLGRSDNEFAALHYNNTRDPLRIGGDLPYGEYSCTIERFTTAPDESTLHSYGPYGKIHLTPTGGDALIAAKNGRTGLCVHSGVLNPAYTQWKGLRPTHGCCRTFDEVFLDILTECGAALETGEQITCSVVPPQ